MEIERKFLVDHEKWDALIKPEPNHIIQAYLLNTPEKTIRIRVKGDKGFITIKGKTIGISRSEFEYGIPLSEANEMIDLFAEKTIDKYRYEIKIEKHLWEVDVFQGKLKGLILAEIELNSEAEKFVKPDWVTEDVSHDEQYYNAKLIEKL